MTEIAEVRVLVFSYQDVKKALSQFAEESDGKIPDQDIEKILHSDENDHKFQIIFQSEIDPLLLKDMHKGKKIDDVSLNIDETGLKECLIKLCKERLIPIPLKASKELEASRNSISMWIRVGETDGISQSENFSSVHD